jgi:ATP-dependent protease Clp ATPase subunit
MSETKEMLEATVKGLQDKVNQLNMDLKSKQKELEDINKPAMSVVTYAELEDIIGNTLADYNFDCGEFEYEFSINYDNKLELSDLTFTDYYSLSEAVMKAITNHFKVAQDESTNTEQ